MEKRNEIKKGSHTQLVLLLTPSQPQQTRSVLAGFFAAPSVCVCMLCDVFGKSKGSRKSHPASSLAVWSLTDSSVALCLHCPTYNVGQIIAATSSSYTISSKSMHLKFLEECPECLEHRTHPKNICFMLMSWHGFLVRARTLAWQPPFCFQEKDLCWGL